MTDCTPPWGLDETADASGRYQRPELPQHTESPALVLTEAGEVLIRRGEPKTCCQVAIIIGKATTGLSRPQVERMQRTWDIALAVANGESEHVVFQPMPHHWRFSRVDYQAWDEWLEQRAERTIRQASSRDDRGVQR